MTRREEQIARETARMDICLPNGGHEYVEGQDGCIHCGEPFPIIARDYGTGLMPGRVGDKVWVPNGTISLSSEYTNIVRVDDTEALNFDDMRHADLVIVGDEIIKNRFGAEGKIIRTLQSFFSR